MWFNTSFGTSQILSFSSLKKWTLWSYIMCFLSRQGHFSSRFLPHCISKESQRAFNTGCVWNTRHPRSKGVLNQLVRVSQTRRRHKHLILVLRRGRQDPLVSPPQLYSRQGFGPWGDIKWQELASNTQTTGVAAIEIRCTLPFATHAVENQQQRETWTIF